MNAQIIFNQKNKIDPLIYKGTINIKSEIDTKETLINISFKLLNEF